jgi:hypothetical protein
MTSARTAPQVEVKAAQSCPLCHDPLTTLPQLLACPDCQVIHHHACVAEMGQCGTMGCGGLQEGTWKEEERTTAKRPALSVKEEDARGLAAVAYVANVAGAAFVLPVLIMLHARKRGDDFARHHAKQALFLSIATMCTLGLLLPVMIAFSVIGAWKSFHGEWWTPPGLRRFADDAVLAKWEKQRRSGQIKPFPQITFPFLGPRKPDDGVRG